MKAFFNHIKSIAYFLAMLILFQSCVVYNKSPSTIEEATSDEEMPIKIINKDGHVYKFRLIEENDGNIIGFRKAEKEYIYKEDIFQYVILSPEPHTVPIDTALNHNGLIRILTNNRLEGFKSHEFMKIIEDDEKIIGYKIDSKDAMPVIIPLDDIDKILLKDEIESASKTTKAIIASSLGIGIIVLIIIFINDFSGWGWWS